MVNIQSIQNCEFSLESSSFGTCHRITKLSLHYDVKTVIIMLCCCYVFGFDYPCLQSAVIIDVLRFVAGKLIYRISSLIFKTSLLYFFFTLLL